MMNPEMMRLAQEQMSRMSPDALAMMEQRVMSNPGLVKLATESMKNMTTDDFKRAAQQLNHTKPEDILHMTEKIASAKPEDFAAMKAQADAQMSYVISGAKMLKQQGNELHSRGQYADAAAKYKLAKDNLKNIPSAAGQTLQVQCSVNLMSCYLSKAHEISPEDETIAEALRDAEGKLAAQGGGTNLPRGVVIEEIVEEDNFIQPSSPQNVDKNSDETLVNNQSLDDQPSLSSPPSTTDMQDVVRNYMEDPAMREMFASMMKDMSPDVMANMCKVFGMEVSKEDAAKAQQVMKWMDRAQRGVEAAQKTKNWLIARKGLIIAIVMLIVAFIILQLLGFIGR